MEVHSRFVGYCFYTNKVWSRFSTKKHNQKVTYDDLDSWIERWCVVISLKVPDSPILMIFFYFLRTTKDAALKHDRNLLINQFL